MHHFHQVITIATNQIVLSRWEKMYCNWMALRWHRLHCHNNLYVIIVIISANHPNENTFTNRILSENWVLVKHTLLCWHKMQPNSEIASISMSLIKHSKDVCDSWNKQWSRIFHEIISTRHGMNLDQLKLYRRNQKILYKSIFGN